MTGSTCTFHKQIHTSWLSILVHIKAPMMWSRGRLKYTRDQSITSVNATFSHHFQSLISYDIKLTISFIGSFDDLWITYIFLKLFLSKDIAILELVFLIFYEYIVGTFFKSQSEDDFCDELGCIAKNWQMLVSPMPQSSLNGEFSSEKGEMSNVIIQNEIYCKFCVC